MFEKFLSTLKSIYQSKEIRKKIVFSIFIMIIFRLLASIPVVGIPAEAIKELFSGNSFGETLSTVSGGVLETASVVAIGLTPYINASIVIQLLTPVVPKLQDLKDEGSQGQRTLTMYTRLLAVPLAVMQSVVIYSTLQGFGLMPDLDTLQFVTMTATFTGGAMLMMWMGELVTEDGVGQGSSYLIFLGIISGLPNIVASNLRTADTLQSIVFFIVLIAIVMLVILISEGERRVKVMYSRRVRETGNQENYIPIKITQFGVMPVIFAVSLLSFPVLIAQFVVGQDYSVQVTQYAQQVIDILQDPLVQNLGTFLLVVAFSFFYVTVVFNAKDVAENLQKNGGFVPGIRPGEQTAKHLRAISFRLTVVGALFLGILAILPAVLSELGVTSAQFMTGTGILIAVGVVLDMKRQIESMIVVRSYERYV